MYESTSWRLDELFSGLDDPKIEDEIAELEQLIVEMEGFRPKLAPDLSEEDFLDILELNAKINFHAYRIYGFGSLSFASDTQNQRAQTYLARMGQLFAQIQNRTLFFSLWWKDLDNGNVDRLTESAGELRYWLEKIRQSKPFTLTEQEEKIINIKDSNGPSALQRLYSSITNRYLFNLELDGEMQSLSREQLSMHFRSPDPAIRAQVYQELFRVYGDEAPILGQIYQALMRDWHMENVELRGYQSALSVRNHSNDIPDEVVDTLIRVVRRNSPIFHRFFALKARWLGSDKLRRYDVYAPVTKSKSTYTFDESVNLVLDSFHEFEPRIAELAKRVITDQHFDSENRPGKQSGAFCATLGPSYTPWVLQSFNGEARDISTIAHEFGHAIHSMLAEGHSILTQQPTLPLAETASTFSEMLLLDKLLAINEDPELRKDLLFSTMDDAYATIMRQTYFAVFEIEAHAAIQKDASVDDLSDTYLTLLREQFGDVVEVSDDFRHEWVAIPHFYRTPFYVYAYAFGQLLALALYGQFKEEGKAMIPRFIEILAAGGSQAPVEILKNAGIDVYSDAFWQAGFDYLANNLEQLEAIPIPA